MTERLTEKTDEGIWVKESHGNNAMKTLYRCYGAEPLPNYSNCDEGYCGMDKLAEYETAEKEGRLVVLPCKVGDTVYFPNKYAEIIIPFTIVEFCMFKDEYAIIDDSDNEYKIEDFGKAVFLTHEEAEKALKEMEKGVMTYQ